MTRRPTFILASMIALLSMYWTPSLAKAQAPPFNGGGVVGFDPEISVVNTGALMDAQVVVSDDRRYVTINARPSQSRLIALNVFQRDQGRGAEYHRHVHCRRGACQHDVSAIGTQGGGTHRGNTEGRRVGPAEQLRRLLAP